MRGPALKQIRPGTHYRVLTERLNHRVLNDLKVEIPPWYHVLESIPPSETLTRPLPPQHQQTKLTSKKASRLYQPQQLTYEEDHLRQQFYQDHPWELARPRMIIEMDGKDLQRVDWSKGLQQRGVPLTGESVVQRQMWLMHNVPGMAKQTAYDQVRKEFYALRQEEEIERRVAKEEARMVGSYFGQSFLRVGMRLENQRHEKWKGWAATEIDRVQNEQQEAYTSYGDEDNVDETPEQDEDDILP